MLLVAFLTGCKKVEKDVQNYYPKVKTIGATIQPDGSLKLTGELTSAGTGDLYGVGFCIDTVPNVQMHINQRLVDTIFDNEFSGVYTGLDATKRYYFKAWAVNEYGYALGEELSVDNINIDSSVIPCRPVLNTIKLEGSWSNSEENFFRINAPDQSGAENRIEATSNSQGLHITFHQKPVPGIYKTAPTSGSAPGYVEILYNGPGTFGTYAEPGGNVYVSQIREGVIEISICDVNLRMNGSDYKLITRFRSPNY